MPCGNTRHAPYYIDGKLLHHFFGENSNFNCRSSYRICHNLYCYMKKSGIIVTKTDTNNTLYCHRVAPRRSDCLGTNVQNM